MLSVVRATASRGSLSAVIVSVVDVIVYSKFCPPVCGKMLSGLSSGGTISTTPVASTSNFRSLTRSRIIVDCPLSLSTSSAFFPVRILFSDCCLSFVFARECVCMCLFISLRTLNGLPHTVHGCGFSPVCIRR